MSIELRMAPPEDAAAILAIFRPIVRSTAFSFEQIAPTVERMRQRISVTAKYLLTVNAALKTNVGEKSVRDRGQLCSQRFGLPFFISTVANFARSNCCAT